MKEYYILQMGTTILAVFETLEECLIWKPSSELDQDPVIQRVKRWPDGRFTVQMILVKASVFTSKLE